MSREENSPAVSIGAGPTFASALGRWGEIRTALVRHAEVYQTNLQRHFRKHLELLK